jgi:hypothetical protein
VRPPHTAAPSKIDRPGEGNCGLKLLVDPVEVYSLRNGEMIPVSRYVFRNRWSSFFTTAINMSGRDLALYRKISFDFRFRISAMEKIANFIELILHTTSM